MKKAVFMFTLGLFAATQIGVAESVRLKTGEVLEGEVSLVGGSIVEVRTDKGSGYHSLTDLDPADAKRIAPNFDPDKKSRIQQKKRSPSSRTQKKRSPSRSASGTSRKPDVQFRLAFRDHDEARIVSLLSKYPKLVKERGYLDASALCEAIANNMSRAAAKMLEAGADVNAKGKDKKTPLHWACAMGDAGLAEALIEKGAVVQAGDRRGNQPLHAAASADASKIVSLLIEKGGDVNAQSSDYGQTPLHYAARAGAMNAAAILLKNNADINVRDRENNTPLHEAANGGQLRMVEFLLQKEAYPNARNGFDRTALHHAAETGAVAVAQSLIDAGFDVNARDVLGRTPLHLAAELVQADMVICLLKNEPRSDIRGKGYGWGGDREGGKTPLHVACMFARKAVVRALIDAGFDVDARDGSGGTPLHDVAKAKYPSEDCAEVIKLLVAARADVNVPDDSGKTPLIVAAEATMGGSREAVDILIKRGADVNVADRLGCTALHYAAKNNNAGFVDLLLVNKADKNARDFDGRTPLDRAEKRGESYTRHVQERLKRAGAKAYLRGKTTPPLHLAAQKRDKAKVQQLLSEGADVNAVDEQGFTPLHRAIRRDGVDRNDIEILLLEARADPGINNAGGQTPLHTALKMLSPLKVEALLAHKAPVNIQDANQDTALHIGASMGKWKLVTLLLTAGADPNLQNREGNTALHLVSGRRSSGKGIQLLLSHGADPKILNRRGQTPVERAQLKDDAGAIQAWAEAGIK